MTEGVDLEAYLQRIGYTGGLDPTVETLTALHRAHVLSIPFENLDILLGRPIRLDLASLQGKLVRDRRGGYCFEQNALFAAVLEHLGFAVTRLAARVSMGEERTTPRTHMILAVDLEGTRWLADVGFGGDTLLDPVRFDDDEPVQQGAWAFRLATDGDVRVLFGHPRGWLARPLLVHAGAAAPGRLRGGEPLHVDVAPFAVRHEDHRAAVGPRRAVDADRRRVQGRAPGRNGTMDSRIGRRTVVDPGGRFELGFPPGTRFGRD